MNLVTIQYELITKNILYPNKFKSQNENKSSKCYKKLFQDYKLKTGFSIDKAIWCFKQLYKEKSINIEKDLPYIFNLGVYESNYIYNLNVPEKYIVLTSFYDWVSLISREEDKEEFLYLWNNIYDLKDVDVIQAIIPYIKKEWIINIYKNKNIL